MIMFAKMACFEFQAFAGCMELDPPTIDPVLFFSKPPDRIGFKFASHSIRTQSGLLRELNPGPLAP